MLFEDRQNKIIKMLETRGSISISEIVDHFNISKVTARKHLRMISKNHPITCVRGGAILGKAGTSYEPTYDTKYTINIENKKKIGAFAASLVSSGTTVLLDSGSTTWHVGSYMLGKGKFTVITNDIKIAMVLTNTEEIELFLAGGKIRPYIYSSFGKSAEEYINNFNVDTLFLSADAVDLNRGITNAEATEAELKKEMIKASKEVILVADSSKFNKVSLANVSDFSNIHHVICDKNIPARYKEFFRSENIKLSLV